MRRLTSSEDALRPENPRKNANWLSIFTMFYTIKIFRKGCKRDMDERDLTKPLDSHKSSILGEKLAILWSREVHRARERQEHPSLSKVLCKCFGKEVLSYGLVLFFMEIVIRLFQPLFLGLFLRYFSKENKTSKEPQHSPKYLMRLFYFFTGKQSPIEKSEAVLYAFGIFLCSFLSVHIIHPTMLAVMHAGMKLRVACCSLMYRKTLRLNLESSSGAIAGSVINLMSNDVNRFDVAIMFLHYLWIAPLQMTFCLYFMYKEVKIAAVVGVAAIVAIIPIQGLFGALTSNYRLKTALRTDERVRQMNEIIMGMQVIKMYTWEYAFANVIHKLRMAEMNYLKKNMKIRGVMMSFMMFTTRLSIFFTVLTIVLRKTPPLTAESVFVITAYYQILRQTMTSFFPQAISQIAELHVAINRICRFMMTEETTIGDPRPLDPYALKRRTFETLDEDAFITLHNVTAKFGDFVCVQNINLEMFPGQLTAIIGQVGSGKSSLLHLVMGEIQPCLGKAVIEGVISYACQEPWLFAGSVRQNILFGREFDRYRYYSVVRACALTKDFTLLPYGDQTIVGERGISLSGGQRARVNLARAVYKVADIYLLDDPLSAVDTAVGKELFENCIAGFLKEKIVILATHQLQYLHKVDQIILMDATVIVAKGSYEELQKAGLYLSEYMQDSVEEPVEDGMALPPPSTDKIHKIIKTLSITSNMNISVIDIEGIKEKELQKEESEMRTTGAVGKEVYKEYFKAAKSPCLIALMIALFLLAQILVSGGDFFLSEWINVEEKKNQNVSLKNHNSGLVALGTHGSVGVYAVIIFLTIVVALTRSCVFFNVCMRASITLHDRMFESIITASMKFFNANSSGRILNRFSKDLGQIDEILPNALLDSSQIMLTLLGTIIVVAMVNYYLLIPIVFICILFYIMRKLYLYTSRSVKRMEGIARSPVFAHLTATIQGLTTIRANGAEILLTKEFDKYQDLHSSAWFMFLATARAFGLWLDMICALFIGLVTFNFLFFEDDASRVGLAITQVMGLTGLFQWGLKESAELVNQMTSVERVLEFTRVEKEPDLKSAPEKKPPDDWPDEGNVEFDDLVMRYKPDHPPVLKNLSFKIEPKEKIGIVGRTGAGKSSLIAALFRLSLFEGKVIIDGINTSEIGLHDLRRKISIIPQEPVLFSGTLRHNMDPFNQYEDNAIVDALVVVEIKVALTEGTGCLSHYVSEGGFNISVGERQMVCLARAILKNNVILVLDEATANVDPKTDHFIQTTIRSRFSECTVLTIAHRLHTIMDSDRVLVMDAGVVAEFDHPHILLQNKEGVFTQMVKKTGNGMEQNLRRIAEENYKLKGDTTSAK